MCDLALKWLQNRKTSTNQTAAALLLLDLVRAESSGDRVTWALKRAAESKLGWFGSIVATKYLPVRKI